MEETKQTNNVTHFDYKDVSRIKNHLNPHARMHSRKRTGLTATEQRNFAQAVKRSRFMALVPFVSH